MDGFEENPPYALLTNSATEGAMVETVRSNP